MPPENQMASTNSKIGAQPMCIQREVEEVSVLRLKGRRNGVIDSTMVVCFNGFVKDSERFIEEVSCTAPGDMNLLEHLLPSSFLLEGLKTAMLFIQDRLLRLQHETIDGGHRCLVFNSGNGGSTVTDFLSREPLYKGSTHVIN